MSGALFDSVALNGIELGRVEALIHEELAGRKQWLKPSRILSLTQTDGPVERVMDFILAYEQNPLALVSGPLGTYETHYRVVLGKDQPYFTVQCLSVTNTDKVEWTLKSFFHYVTSTLGGSPQDDELPLKGVPNYYGMSSLWFDASVGAGFGAIPPPGMKAYFWKDEQGTQHPDLYREVNVVLKPGQTWTAEDPPAVVFGVQGTLTDRPWNRVADSIEAEQKINVKWWP